MLTKICEGCRTEFTICYDNHGHINKKKRFCTRSCHLRHKNIPGAAHAIKGGNAAGIVNIAKLRGTGTKGYVKENGRHQHRVVAERILKRNLLPGEVVHHKDEDKHNNSPENLVVTSQSQHIREHIPEMHRRRREKHGY